MLKNVSVHLEQYQAKNGYLLRGLGPMTPSGPLPSLWLFFIEAFP